MLSGPCASASNCYSAATHQHLVDLTVAPTASSESSASVFPLCTLHGAAHSAHVALLVRVLTPVPFASLTLSLLFDSVFPLVHETGTCSASAPSVCAGSLTLHLCWHVKSSCPCIVAVKLRQPLAPSGSSCQCAHLCVRDFLQSAFDLPLWPYVLQSLLVS